MKLKVVVNLKEQIEDPNLDLVQRGFFPTLVNFGGHRVSEDNVKARVVQTVVVFDMSSHPDDGQLAFLKHLWESRVIGRCTLHDDSDTWVREYYTDTKAPEEVAQVV